MKSQQFHELLVLNIHDVVEHKLKSEVDICKFLTRERLGKLLNEAKDKDKFSAIKNLLDKLFVDKEDKDKSSAIANLLDTLFFGKEFGKEVMVKLFDKLVEMCLGYNINYGDVEENKTSCKYPWRELFVWALLFNRPELADMFWQRTENKTAMALVASILLRSLAEDAEDDKTLRDRLNNYSREFEERAIGVLNQCYKDNKLDSEELVKMKVDECGDKSILMIADVEHLEFMGETCCEVVIWKQWLGRTHNAPVQDQASRGVCAAIQDNLNGRYLATRTKLIFHMMSYVIMLVTFSVMLLTELPRDSQDSHIGLLEWIVCFLMFNWIIHEAMQVGSICLRTNERTKFQMIKSGCKEHLRNVWNNIDMAGCVLFIVSFSLRLGDQLDFALGFYSVTILLLYMRLLQMFTFFSTFGLLVCMTRWVVRDLLTFLLVLAVFIVSYGVASRALLFPKSEISWALLRDIVYLPYWQIYGDLQLDDIGGDDSLPGHYTLAIFLFAVYMMMAHILLLNLLIATFTHSITQIQADKKKSWYYAHVNSCSLLREYERCQDVPPPFSTLVYVYQLCRWLIPENGKSNITEVREENRRQELQRFETVEMWKYLRFLKKAEAERMQSLEETVNTLRGMLEEMKHRMNRNV